MAAAIRASSGGTVGAGSTTITVTKPTGTVDGDYILVALQWEDTMSAPDGTWTILETPGNKQRVFGKIASGEGASWNFTTSTGSRGAWACVSAQDIDQTTPVNVSGSQIDTSGTAVVSPSVTTSVADTLLVGFFAVNGTTTFTADGGMTELQDNSTTGRTLEAAWEARSATGATGTRTATAGSSGSRAATMVALAPPAAPSSSGTLLMGST